MSLLSTIEHVEIDSLVPLPGNPRRGDVKAIKQSLVENDQYEPIIIQKSTRHILAGNHRVQAARELGWTEIAAVVIDVDDDRATKIALSSNRIAELGSFDEELLAAQLRELSEFDMLEGTGYNTDDVDEALARLRKMSEGPSPLASTGQREHRDPSMKEVVLIYSPDQFKQVEQWLGIVQHEKGLAGTSESVYEALKIAAQTLNG